MPSAVNMASDPTTSGALVRKRTDTGLMPPPPPAKRIKRPRKVLDEDTYTDALSHIIARDFFPGLLENQTQHEYLDAVESKDEAWISSAGRRLQQVMTPGRCRLKRPVMPTPGGGQTPTGYVGDTPASVISATSTVMEEKLSVDTNMSLGAFQSKYTSEDNESFYKLLDKQNQKRAEKYAWLWRGNKLPSKQQLKQLEIEAKIAQTRGGSLTDDGYKDNRLAIRDKDDRPASAEAWKSKPKNELMFGPDGVDDGLETAAQRAQAESRAPPKTVVYANTRVPGQHSLFRPEDAIPDSPSLSAARDAIAGKASSAYQDSHTGPGDETPRVNGYAFVDDEDDEPVPAPTPRIKISAGDTTPNPFQLQDQGKREALHHRMVDKISKSKRTSAVQGLTGRVERTPVPKFPSSPRVFGGSMTPAAQRLWGKIDSGSRGREDFSPFSRPNGTSTPTPRKVSGLRGGGK